MASSVPFPDSVDIAGDLTVRGSILPAITRATLAQENLAAYAVPLTSLRVWDAAATNLPGTSAADDLGLTTGTWGTDSLTVSTGDLKAAGATTRYCLGDVSLPPEYVAGETVNLRISAGMETTVADTSATVDVEAYLADGSGGIGSDLVSTSATSCNSLTFADLDFALTATTLNPGDNIQFRVAVAVNDAATGTAVIATLGAISLLADIKG